MLQVDLVTQLQTFHLSLNFNVQPGQTTVLLGESGAGKSTLLRLIAGLLRADHGSITFDGVIYYDSTQNIHIPPQERPFGYVFQDYVLFPHLSVFENVSFGLRAQRVPQQQIQQRVAEALAMLHLNGLGQRKPAQISGGQQQRVALARALVLQPQLLLLDEPLSALDVQTKREVRQELRYILTEARITTIMVTHHYLDSLLFGDQILVIDQGKIIQQGSSRHLQEYPRSSYIAELVETNFFQGKLSGYEGGNTCSIQINGGQLMLIATLKEYEQQTETTRPPVGSDAYVVIDPHSITLHTEEPMSSARNVLRGRVLSIMYLNRNPLYPTGSARISLQMEQTSMPLLIDVTSASISHLSIQEGQTLYASFKATEASAYI